MATITAPRQTRRKLSAKRGITPQDLLRLHFVATPRVSPDGRHVVLVKKHVGKKNEYVTNLWMVSRTGAEGSEAWEAPRQFTNGGKDTQPRWSPDGRRIAFVGARTEGNPQVFVIDVQGGEAVPLTTLPEGSIGTFAWSPDGGMLGVSFREQDPDWSRKAKEQRKEKGLSDPPRVLDHHWYRLDGDGYFNGQRYRLLVVDTETGEHRTVYAKDTLGFFTFDFSPDSRQLVVSSNTERRAGLKAWNDDLLRVNVASGKVTKIPPSMLKEWIPCFQAPDSAELELNGK